MDGNSAMVVAQQAQRISSLEDLLRRNEGTLAAVLGRVKDVELALNTMHRALGKVGPDLAATIDELKGTRRRVDVVDQTYQQKLKDIEGALLNEIRANKPIPLTQDQVFIRLAQDVTQQRGELQETINQVRKLTDVATSDGKAIRAVEQDTKWLAEQFKDQAALQRDFTTQQSRRNEQTTQQIQATMDRVQTVDADLRRVIDTVVKATREETFLRMEQEAKARLALQSDFVSAFNRMREDVVKGFTETASNLKNLDETAHSLETVLRAEVRSRMAAQEEAGKRIEVVEERLRREALSAAEYLRALDTQMSAALRDVRDVSASECRSQLDSVWRSVDDVTEQIKKINARQASSASTIEEVTNQRTKMTIEQVTQDSRDEMMRVVENRIATSTAAMESMATKSELQELHTRLSLKIQEVERHAKAVPSSSSAQRVSFDPSVDTSTTASSMKYKKISDRVDDAEKQLIVIAEAIRDVHEELVDKLEKLETQSSAMDALQKSLQETFQKDQASVAEQTSDLRQQIVSVLEELEKAGKLSVPPPEAAAKTDADGADDTAKGATSPTPDGAAKTDANHDKSPVSASVAFAQRNTDHQLQAIRKDITELQHNLRRDVAELKTQHDQNFDRHAALVKTQREDVAALRGDIAAVSTRAQENAELLSQRLHDTTDSSNANFVKINDELARLGGSPQAQTVASPNADAAAAAEKPAAASGDIAAVHRRCDTIEGNVKGISTRLDSTAAKQEMDATDIARLETRLQKLEKLQPGGGAKQDDAGVAPTTPKAAPATSPTPAPSPPPPAKSATPRAGASAPPATNPSPAPAASPPPAASPAPPVDDQQQQPPPQSEKPATPSASPTPTANENEEKPAASSADEARPEAAPTPTTEKSEAREPGRGVREA